MYVCVKGKVSKLTVITTNAGAGTLAVHIEGPSKLAIVCTELDEGYEFTYTPMAAGNYMIIIKYCSVTIAGCPFKAVVTGRRPYGNPPWFFYDKKTIYTVSHRRNNRRDRGRLVPQLLGWVPPTMYCSFQLLGRSFQKARNFTASSHQNAGFSIGVFKKFSGVIAYRRTLIAEGGDPLLHPTP